MQQIHPQLAQVVPAHGGQQPDPTETADGVRGCVAHDAVHGEDDESIGHACDVTLAHHRVGVGELTTRNHLEQLLAGIDAFGLIPAVRFTGGHIGLAHHKAQGLAVGPHRSVYAAHADRAEVTQNRRPVHPFAFHGGVEFGGLVFGHHLADDIVGSQGHHGGRAALLRHNILPFTVFNEQQQVRETEIGHHLPVGYKMVQPFTISVVKVRTRCKYL